MSRWVLRTAIQGSSIYENIHWNPIYCFFKVHLHTSKTFWTRIRSLSKWMLKKVIHGASMFEIKHWSSSNHFSQNPYGHNENCFKKWKFNTRIHFEWNPYMNLQCMKSFNETPCKNFLKINLLVSEIYWPRVKLRFECNFRQKCNMHVPLIYADRYNGHTGLILKWFDFIHLK